MDNEERVVYKSDGTPEGGPVENKPPKRKKKGGRILLKILLWIVIIGLVVFLTLFLAAKIGQFRNIPELIQYIRDSVSAL